MEPLIHFAVPFAAFTALGVKPEFGFLFSFLALTPDLDVLFHYHRSISHSLIPWVVCAIPFLALMWNSQGVNFVILGLVSIASHMLLDLTGYTPILHPLIKDSYRINLDFGIHFGSSSHFNFNLRSLSKPTKFKRIETLDAQLFSGQGFLISLILLIPTLLTIFE